jgi:hypothetical protein
VLLYIHRFVDSRLIQWIALNVAVARLVLNGVAVLAALNFLSEEKKKRIFRIFNFFFLFFSTGRWRYLRDREARRSASTLTERQTRLLASDDSMSAYLLGLSGVARRPGARRQPTARAVARRTTPRGDRRALAEAASSGTLDYLMSRRFVPNAAVGALSGAASPVGWPPIPLQCCPRRAASTSSSRRVV